MVSVSAAVFAQPKTISQATVYTTTNVIAPEDDDVSNIQNQGGGGGFNFRNMGDGETKTTTYIKNDLVKTNFKSESFRGSIYRDNAARTTTTVFEMMGSKQGFSASDDDQAEMRRKLDSTMKEKAKADTSFHYRERKPSQSTATVAYTEESKKIAGYDCKKAYIITDRLLGKDSLEVWYTPEIKFPNLSSTGGTSGLGNNFGGTNNFDKVDGFVMQYSRDMPRGRKMEVKVTKIEIGDVADKEFVVPKDVEIKSMKDMNGQGGGMFRMMQGNRQ